MGTPINPALTLVKVAADSGGNPGSFANIVDVTGYSADHGAEDPSETFVFGEESPHTRGGENTDEYSIDGLYNVADTNGQNVLKNSRDTGVPCWIQVLHDGTNGYQQKVNVTSYSDSAERDGDWVLVSFTARGIVGTLEEVPES
jgi:hypothetical protein